MDLKVVSPLFLLCGGILIACSKPGPLEQRLLTAENQFRILSATPSSQGEQYLQVIGGLSPLLGEKSYTDPGDRQHKDRLMYRTSLLMAAGLTRTLDTNLGRNPEVRQKHMEGARQLFMNAFLLNDRQALSDLKTLLSASADLTLFERVRIPRYDTLNEQEEKGSHLAQVSVSEPLEFYLLQMVCGDVLRKAKGKQPTIQALTVQIQQNNQLVATGRWDAERDEILLKLH